MFEKLKNFWNKQKGNFVIAGIAILGYKVLDLALSNTNPFSSFIAAAFGCGIAMGLQELWDKFVIKEYDTQIEVKNGNIAVALVYGFGMLAFAIIFHGCISVFK